MTYLRSLLIGFVGAKDAALKSYRFS